MVQNHLSIDFRHTVRGTDSYEFGYNVERSIEVATSIVLQYYDGKKSLPAWYVKNEKRLYADTVNGYWNVDGFTLTFVEGTDPSADIGARVSALESASVQQAGDISELEGVVSGVESSIEEINSTLYVQSSDIASLKTRTTSVENKASTNESNISSLTTRMSTAELNISTHTTDIASLKTRTTAVENKASTNESNISSLTTRITSVEAKIPVIVSYINGTVSYRTASGNSVDFTNGYSAYLQKALVTITAEQSGSGEPSPTNIRPISGVSSVTVRRTGKNLIPATAWNRVIKSTQSYTVTALPDGAINIDGTFDTAGIAVDNLFNQSTTFDNVKWIPEGNYIGYAEYNGAGQARLQVFGYNTAGSINSISGGTPVNRPNSFEVTDSYKYNYARLYIAAGTYNNLKVYPRIYPTDVSATPFEIYKGQSVTVPLVDSSSNPLTVYGGTLDVMTGVLTVTHGEYPSYNGETLPGVWISDRDAYAPGTTPTTGGQVVYELETPLTYQLTPTQITLLDGYNFIVSSEDNISILYPSTNNLVL